MAGLACGSFIARHPGRCALSRHPLPVYAWLEGLTGLAGLILAFMFAPWLDVPALLDQCAGSNVYMLWCWRMLLAALVAGLPSCFMGATFPVVCRVACPPADIERHPAVLYALNTAGAFCGTVATGFVLLPNLGLTNSLRVAALVYVAISISLLLFIKAGYASDEIETTPQAVLPAPAADNRLELIVLSVLVLSGMSALELQIIWMRLFSLTFGSSTYSFCTVVAVCLAGLAAGSSVAAKLKLDRQLPAPHSMGWVLVLAGVFLSASLPLIKELPWLLSSAETFLGRASTLSFHTLLSSRALIAVLIILPPFTALSAVLPLALRFAGDQGPGRYYAASSLGSTAGAWMAIALLAALAAIAESAIYAALTTIALLQLALGAWLVFTYFPGKPPARFKMALLAGFVLLNVYLLALDKGRWEPLFMSSGVPFIANEDLTGLSRDRLSGRHGEVDRDARLLFYGEGIDSTVAVGEEPGANIIYLKNDGKVEVSLPARADLPAPSSDLPTQVLLGELPLLLHAGPARQALLIGYGSGTTAGSMLQSGELKDLTICELERDVYKADKFFQHVNNRPLDTGGAASGKVKALALDGRNYLASVNRKYDVVVAQPAEPWVTGSAGLYTKEFFMLAKRRLARAGIFCQWIQLYAVNTEYLSVLCRTFASVFPETIVCRPAGGGEIILVGFQNTAHINLVDLKRKLVNRHVRRDLCRAGIYDVYDLLAVVRQGPSELRSFGNDYTCRTHNHELNTDDNLLVEYQLPKFLGRGENLVAGNIAAMEATPVKLSLLTGEKAADNPVTESPLLVATRLLADGSYGEAASRLEDTLRSDPFNLHAHNLLGVTFLKMRQYDDSEKHLRASLELDPNQLETRCNLAKVFLNQGKEKEGLSQLKLCSALEPADAHPLLLAIAYFMQQKQWSLAKSNLDSLLQGKHAASPVCYLLGSKIAAEFGDDPASLNYLHAYEFYTGSKLTYTARDLRLKAIFDAADLRLW